MAPPYHMSKVKTPNMQTYGCRLRNRPKPKHRPKLLQTMK